VQRFFSANPVEPLGDREVGVVASTFALGRDGLVVEPKGISLSDFRRNPICLWQHLHDSPVGTATNIGLVDDYSLGARIRFAPEGVSALADQVCSLVKAGVVNAVSIGFDPIETVPSKKRGEPTRVVRSTLLEISFVSVPADVGAGVVQRSLGGSTLFRSLPACPSAAIGRASERVKASAAPYSPTIHTWLLVEQRKRERDELFSFEARQRELRRLEARG
jgi:HK97 family phage prohead protease